MAESEIILETQNLTKQFNGVVAVDDLDVELDSRGVTSIIGPNGAGKSTLIDLISGELDETDGSIRFKGEDITDLSQKERIEKGIARSFQHPEFYPKLTAFENLQSMLITSEHHNSNIFRPLSAHTGVKEQAEALLEDFGLGEYRETNADELPHGVRKILDVAMAFATNPEIILIDEPTSAVSTKERIPVIETIIDLAQKRNIKPVIIEHDMELVADYSDTVIAMHQGAVLMVGKPDVVLQNNDVKNYIRGEA